MLYKPDFIEVYNKCRLLGDLHTCIEKAILDLSHRFANLQHNINDLSNLQISYNNWTPRRRDPATGKISPEGDMAWVQRGQMKKQYKKVNYKSAN